MNQKDFNTLVANLFKGNQIDNEIFWECLQKSQSDTNAAHYSSSILENIMSSMNSSLVNMNEQRLYSTLYAIEYYKNRKPKSQSMISSYNKYREKKKIIGHPKWILDLFINPLKDEMFGQNFISQLVFAPKNIDWNLNIQVQMNSQIQQAKTYVLHRQMSAPAQQYYSRLKLASSPDKIGVETKTMSLTYVCFLDYVRGNFNEIRPNEYHHMVNILKALMHLAKVDNSSISYLCVFLHFIINCITFHSCTEENILKQLIITVNYLRNFHAPVSEMAAQLFDLLYKQIRIPGNAFRKKLRYDFPALDMKESSFLNKQFYIITQSSDSFSWPEDRSLMNLRKQMIWHIMKVCEIEKMAQYKQLVRNLANEAAYQLYFKTLKIIDIASQLQVFDKIKEIMKNYMNQLLSQTAIRYKKEDKQAQQLQKQQFDSLTQQENSLNIFKYPQYQLIHVPIYEFLNKKSNLSFHSIIKKFRAQHTQLVFYQEHISIVFYGTSVQFVSLVQILSGFLEQADIQQSMQLHIYYLPKALQRSYSIASYIASKDIWYRNFIYYLFQQNMIFPSLELSQKNKNLFPSYLINKSLHMYIRQAKRIFLLRVYRCLLKIKQVSEVKQIFFTEYVSLGLFTEAEFIRESKLKNKQKKQKYQKMNSLEIVRQKLQKYRGYKADISFQYIQPLSSQTFQKSQKEYAFEDIQICNMPKQNFFGHTPDPSSNTLKLSILNEKDGKCFRKEMFNRQNFRQNKSTEEVYNAFKELFSSYSIRSMRIRNRGEQPLKAIVDGIIYQNVQSIQISSPQTANGLPITLPILTFLPFK